MPYISRERRGLLDPYIAKVQEILKVQGSSEGDLNYVLSRLVADYFVNEPRYQTIARITGVLENVKQEFYQRVATPYEDSACAINDDLPEFTQALAAVPDPYETFVAQEKQAAQAEKIAQVQGEIDEATESWNVSFYGPGKNDDA